MDESRSSIAIKSAQDRLGIHVASCLTVNSPSKEREQATNIIERGLLVDAGAIVAADYRANDFCRGRLSKCRAGNGDRNLVRKLKRLNECVSSMRGRLRAGR